MGRVDATACISTLEKNNAMNDDKTVQQGAFFASISSTSLNLATYMSAPLLQEAPHYRCGRNAPSLRFITGSPRLAVARIRLSLSCIFCSLSNPISIFRRTVFWVFQTKRRAGRGPLTTSALTVRRLFFITVH